MGEESSRNVGKTTPANKSSKSSNKSAKAATSISAGSASAIPEKIDLVWAVAFIVVAFVIGFFVRGLFLPATPGTTTPPINSTSGALDPNIDPALGGTTGAQQAPTLNEDQLTQPLPQGHPGVGGTTAPSTAPSGSTGGNTGTGSSSDSFTNVPDALGGNTSGMGNTKSDVPAADSQDSKTLKVEKDPSKTGN